MGLGVDKTGVLLEVSEMNCPAWLGRVGGWNVYLHIHRGITRLGYCA